MSQTTFAKRAGVKLRTAQRWESGETFPELEHQENIALALDLPRDFVLSQFASEQHGPALPLTVNGVTSAIGDNVRRLHLVEVEQCTSPCYVAEDVKSNPSSEALSALLEIAMARNPSLDVRPIRNLEELEVLWHIDNAAYGTENVTFESFQSWWRAYPCGLQAILHEGDVLGAVGIWPVPEDWQRDFWAGISSEEDLTAEMIAQAAEGQRTCWYVSGVVLDASRQRTGAIAPLLRKAALAWWQEANISQPALVTAWAISEHGERLLNRFGFSLVNHCAKAGFPIYARTVTPRDLPLMLG